MEAKEVTIKVTAVMCAPHDSSPASAVPDRRDRWDSLWQNQRLQQAHRKAAGRRAGELPCARMPAVPLVLAPQSLLLTLLIGRGTAACYM